MRAMVYVCVESQRRDGIHIQTLEGCSIAYYVFTWLRHLFRFYGVFGCLQGFSEVEQTNTVLY